MLLVLVVGLPLCGIGALAAMRRDAAGWQTWPRLLAWIAAQLACAALFLLVAMLVSPASLREDRGRPKLRFH